MSTIAIAIASHHIDSARIILLLLKVQQLIAGHHFPAWTWIQCQPGHPALMAWRPVPRLRAVPGCTVISVAQRSAAIIWR